MPQQRRPQPNQTNGKVPWLSSRRPTLLVMLSQLMDRFTGALHEFNHPTILE